MSEDEASRVKSRMLHAQCNSMLTTVAVDDFLVSSFCCNQRNVALSGAFQA